MATIKKFNQYFSHDLLVNFVTDSLLSVSEGKGSDATAKIEEYKSEFRKIKDIENKNFFELFAFA